jgi:hypothetical protein
MSKTGVVSALALAAMAGMFSSAAVAGPMPTALTFDGYCDGVTNIVLWPNSGIAVATHAYENCQGYSDTSMIGPKGVKVNGNNIGFAATDGSFTEFGQTFLYVIKADHTWNLLSAESGMELNSGTWSSGYAASGVRGGVPSFVSGR